MTSGAKVWSGVMISIFCAAFSGELGGLQAGVITRIVEQQDIAPRFHIPGNDVPGRSHQIISGRENLGVGQAACGDDHPVLGFVVDGAGLRQVLSTLQSAWAVGRGLAVGVFALIYSLVPQDMAWRVMFIVGLLPSFLIIGVRRNVEEPDSFQRL